MKATFSLNNADFLKYHILISSLPNIWKIKIRQGNIEEEPRNFLIDKVKALTKSNQFMYKIQLERMEKDIKAHKKMGKLISK